MHDVILRLAFIGCQADDHCRLEGGTWGCAPLAAQLDVSVAEPSFAAWPRIWASLPSARRPGLAFLSMILTPNPLVRWHFIDKTVDWLSKLSRGLISAARFA